MQTSGRGMRDLWGDLTPFVAYSTIQGTLKALMMLFLRVNFTVEFNM